MSKLRYVAKQGAVFTAEESRLGQGARVTVTMPQALKSLSHALLLSRFAAEVSDFINWHKCQEVGVRYNLIDYDIVFDG
jgi:hypothetical protein